MNIWSKSSLEKLKTCHGDLQTLANHVLLVHDCTVVWGSRNEKQQNDMFLQGRSELKYPYSKHNQYPSIAIDLAPYVPELGGVITRDREYSLYFSGIVLGIADILYERGDINNRVRWGGNWSTKRDKNFKNTSFYDGLHYELVIS
jgi:peptidoglycan L-alanyl-D-glutamate endopeptidase CwlK